MTASTNDYWKKTGTSTVTTLSAPGKALGATSINVGSTTNYPSDTGVIVSIRTVDTAGNLIAGTHTEWSATVTSGTSLAIVATPVYGSDQIYAAGSTTQVAIRLSSYAHNKLIDGLLVQHTQTGAHSAITADSIVTTGNGGIGGTLAVTGTSALTGVATFTANPVLPVGSTSSALSNANLNTTAGDIGGAWKAWTPTISAAIGTFTSVTASGLYTQIGKTIIFTEVITITNVGTANSIRSTLPITAKVSADRSVAYGREDAVVGLPLQTRLTSATVYEIFKSDGNTAAVNNYKLIMNGFYEAA